MRLFEFLDKVNEQGDDNYPRPVDELKKLIAIAEQQKDVIESLAREAQKITTEIKYDQTVSDIVVRIRQLIEKINFDDKGYKSEVESAIDDALNAMNELESAVYGIDEPFKGLLRELDNEVLELEYEMDEHKWKRESADPKLQMPKQRDPNWKTMQAKGNSGAAGAHRDKKKEQKQGYEKHKSKSMAEGYGRYWCSTDKKWKTRKGPKQTRSS